MFSRLMPKEGKYFDLFNAHADVLAEGGAALTRLIKALAQSAEQVAAYASEIGVLERKADGITQNTLEQLHTSFITPFDRDEIHELIIGLDDVLDVIEDVAESISLYDIHQVPQEAVAMAVVTEKSCYAIQSVVKLLHSMDNGPAILKLCHEINQLELDADGIFRDAMSKLFRKEPNVHEVVKLKEIYELLESVTDRCKDVAATIESIVLENS
jgi:predicted phosphate transport protein (TIGR00153 family)